MSTATQTAEIEYPDSDGEPIAENTLQFRWIHTLYAGLVLLFRDREDVFVASDLLWYPEEGNPTYRLAPDALVAFGRPKGDRGSYMQWREENIPPQVVFEILSPGNRAGEMKRKREFYERHGAEEYYIYDPDRVTLKGYLRHRDRLRPIGAMGGWTSPRLGIRFDMDGEELRILRPDGVPFATIEEMADQLEGADARAIESDARAEAAIARADRLAAQLRALGIAPEG